MGRMTGTMIQDEVYNILKDSEEGMTAYDINKLLNDKDLLRQKNREREENGDFIVRVKGNGSGNTTTQLSAKLSRSILFDSRTESRRNQAGVLTPTAVYTVRDLDVAHDKMIKSKKKLNKFPKVLRQYHKQKEMGQ
tara:strand:- start:5343 stop:5750 length:408 start_codon:yes stop_codon:yes gene_type:complete